LSHFFIFVFNVGVMSGFIFLSNQSAMSVLNFKVSKPSTCQELLSDWSIDWTAFHLIRWSKMNETLPDMTLNIMLLSMKGYLTWPQTECCYQWKVTWHDPKQNVVINERLHDMTPNRMLMLVYHQRKIKQKNVNKHLIYN
jgi:hypothetical protein